MEGIMHIKDDFSCDGIYFITPDDYSLQLAYMHYDKGHVILPHIHSEVKRGICYKMFL